MEWIQWTLFLLLCITSVLSVFFSIRSRRQTDTVLRGLFAARMNICMGLMLLCLAGIQAIVYSASTMRIIVGAVVMLLGLFNLLAGMRNHMRFQRILDGVGSSK